MLGVSYDGWTTVMGALEPHPALKAVSPQASPADMWLGDDFHHNGAFRLSYGFEYATMMESGKECSNFTFDRYDTYDWYLSLGPLANVQRASTCTGQIPDVERLRARIPNYDAVLAAADDEAATSRASRCRRSTSAGWWDQEDFYGPITIYDALEKHDTREPELPRRRALEPRRLERGAGDDARARSTSAAPRRATSATRCRRPSSRTT